MRITRLLSALLIVWLAAVVAAQSSYPVQQDTYVNDYADVLSAEQEATLRNLLMDLRASNSIEMTVLTVNSFRDYKTIDETFENFATSVFNTWKIGDSARNDGILILAAMQERKVRIEVGKGYGTAFNDDMKAVIEEYIIPDFKRGSYGEGLLDGSRQVIREITTPSSEIAPTKSWLEYQQTPRPNYSSSTSSTSSSTYSSNYSSNDFGNVAVPAAGLGVAGVGVGAVAWGMRAMARRRPRTCPNCGTTMHRLDEYGEDEFLTPGQVSEERVGSIDYDVWECPKCKTHSVFDYPAFLTGFSHCPQCSNKTLGRSSTVIDHATEYSTGLREITARCSHCPYTNTWTEVIPMVQRSHDNDSSSSFSSSSGSDSGGSSSGGGASGSW